MNAVGPQRPGCGPHVSTERRRSGALILLPSFKSVTRTLPRAARAEPRVQFMRGTRSRNGVRRSCCARLNCTGPKELSDGIPGQDTQVR